MKNIGIQKKLQLMTIIICSSILLFAIASMFVFQVLNFRSNFERVTSTLAIVIANNSTGAAAFRDEQAGNEVVGALQAEPTVISATLVLSDGTTIANYGAKENPQSLSHYPPVGKARFAGMEMLLTQPVIQKGEVLGTLYLRADYYKTLQTLLIFYGKVIALVILVSAVLCVILSGLLSRNITRPILQLARTARIIGEKKDYSVRAAVDGRRDELGRLTGSFNEMLARIQSQDAALNLSQQKMEALIHSIDGIVWGRTADTGEFTFVSRQSESILGYPPAAWLETPGFWAGKLHPQDADKAIETYKRLAAKGEPYVFEYRMLAADGRTVWIRESGTVIFEHGRPIALRGILLDVTRQKHDAEELDKLNRKLIDTSRQAGMADVATGVLHNVGNVLNSVSVSATLVRDRLRRSKMGNLQRAATMLTEKNGRLADFLTNDPKGKLLPEYIGSVTEQLAGEHGELIQEIESVGQHIEHIKEIVAMQQNYAKVSGAYEHLSISDLIDDALRINSTALTRHGIHMLKDLPQQLPTVLADRHKVLQILINLLRNAKHALDGRPDDDKKIIIWAGYGDPGFLRIKVTDNGIGIPPENMSKIFNHGFTTKKDGHGFGLHSGANAAQEMGGTLKAHSDGHGKGAEFTLDLPLAAHPSDAAPAIGQKS